MSLKILNKFIVIILLSSLFSCAKSLDNPVLRLYHGEVKIKTPMKEIIVKYGINYRRWVDSNNNSILEYSHCQPHYNLISFLPLPVGKSKFDNYEVILTFDKANRLIDIKKFHDRLTSLPLAVCEPDLADCSLEHKVVERR